MNQCDEGDLVTCDDHVCQARNYICAAHMYLQIVQSAAPTSMPAPAGEFGNADHLLVPPQDQETQYILSRLAFDATRYAMTVALSVADTGGACVDNFEDKSVLSDPESPLANIESISEIYVESLHLQDEAGSEMHRAEMAIADRYFSREPSRARAVTLRYAQENVGLYRYASDTVGGSGEGLGFAPEVARDGMCPSERLSGAGEDAMRVLRLAAAPPQVIAGITDGASTCLNVANAQCTIADLLISGWGASVPSAAGCVGNMDSVRCRLAVITRDPTVAQLTSVDDLAAHYGLTAADFVAARARMAEELVAYTRSFTSLMPGAPLDHDHDSNEYFDRYSATGTEPGPTLGTFYTAVGSYVPVPNVLTINDTTNIPNAPMPAPFGYNVLIGAEDRSDGADGALSGLRRLLGILLSSVV